jgi:hypothetical protein
MKIKIVKDCACERDLHESLNYFRKGLKTQWFVEGEELEVIEEWNNFYGRYYRCKTEGPAGFADIKVQNAEVLDVPAR